MYFCYPETNRLTLEEIDYLFTKEGETGLKKWRGRKHESLAPAAQIERDTEKGSIAPTTAHVAKKESSTLEEEHAQPHDQA